MQRAESRRIQVEHLDDFKKVPEAPNFAAPSAMLKQIRASAQLSQANLAHILGTSFVSVSRWERGAGDPSPAQEEQIRLLHESVS